MHVLRELWPTVPVLALTASATPEITQDLLSVLRLQSAAVMRRSMRRCNLHLEVRPQVVAKQRMQQLAQLVEKLVDDEGSAGLVYVNSRKATSEVSAALNRKIGPTAAPYHAGLSSKVKEALLRDWLAGGVRVLVCTVAFGMGIDHPVVRLVARYDAPSSLERLAQEVGRAARDGLDAHCVQWRSKCVPPLACSYREAQSLQAVRRYLDASTCRHSVLLQHFGEAPFAQGCGACDVCASVVFLVPPPVNQAFEGLKCSVQVQVFCFPWTCRGFVGLMLAVPGQCCSQGRRNSMVLFILWSGGQTGSWPANF